MTKNKLAKLLTANGYDLKEFELRKDEVKVLVLCDEDGDYDRDLTEKRADEISALLGWGGYRCGWGGWVFYKGYKVSDLDYCDPSNPCHY